MILRSLTLVNFRQYRNTTIEFKDGLVGIIGKNGSGKSTLFSAIVCALYGELPTLREYIRSIFAEDTATVQIELVYEIENNEYKVVRQFRGRNLNAQATLFKNDRAIVTGANEVSRAIEKIIGMPKEAFMRSVFAAQGELREISQARGAQRRELIRKIMGFSMLDDILQNIRDDKNEKKKFIEGQQVMLLNDEEIKAKNEECDKLVSKLKWHIKALEELIANQKRIQQQFENKRIEFDHQQKLYQAYNELVHQKTKIAVQIENCTRNLEEAQNKLIHLEKLKSQCENLQKEEERYISVKKLKEELEAVRIKAIEKQKLEEQYKQLNGEVTEKLLYIESETSEMKDYETVVKEIEENVQKKAFAQKTLQDINLQLQQLSKQIGGIQKSIEDRKKHIQQIQKLGRDAECPTCLRPLHDAYDATIARLSSEIDAYQHKEMIQLHKEQLELKDKSIVTEKLIQNIENDINQLQQKKARYDEKKKNIEKSMLEVKKKQQAMNALKLTLADLKEIEFDNSAYENVLNEFKQLESSHAMYIELSTSIKEIPEITKRIVQLTQEKEKLIILLKKNQSELDTLGFSENTYNKVKADYEKLLREKDAIAEKANNATLEQNAIEHEIKQIENELQRDNQNRKKLQIAQQQLELLHRLEAVMDGFRTSVLATVKPVISHYASNLFNQITQGRYQSITVDDDFNFMIFDDGKWYPLDRFSGGEIDCANLCLRIAISNAIRDFSGSGAVGFMAFDEIFGSQDNDRRAAIMNVLYSLQEQYRQIFIISHIDDVKELFPAILHVQTTPQGSLARWL
ncbi:MAG: SMC family ATPase [Spirochaetes bacterium]|nr:SMC family ATPase [Spirochaetota bacterium]